MPPIAPKRHLLALLAALLLATSAAGARVPLRHPPAPLAGGRRMQAASITIGAEGSAMLSTSLRSSAAAAAEAVCRGASPSTVAESAAATTAQAALRGQVEVVTRQAVSSGCVAVIAGANLTAWAVVDVAATAASESSCACAPREGWLSLADAASSFDTDAAEREYRHAGIIHSMHRVSWVACGSESIGDLASVEMSPQHMPSPAAETSVACVGPDGRPVEAVARVSVTAVVSWTA